VALMRIGIDASTWWNRRGFGRFTRGLLQAMFASPRGHHFCLFVDQPPEPEMVHSRVEIVKVATSRPVTKSAIAGDRRSVWDVRRFGRAVSAEPLDLMFFPAVYSWFPIGRRIPSVVTLHDAIAERFPALIFPDWKGRLFSKLKTWLACRQASQIITVSQAAKQEIVQYIGLRPERIDVICEGADAGFHPMIGESRLAARRKAGIPAEGRLLIYVGGVAPHKNVSNLLIGFANILSGVPDLRLAIVGDAAGDGFLSNYQDVMAQAHADVRLRDRVHFTGFVADADLAALYSDALAAVQPSLSEGFGLPAIEAISCGTPVLATRAGATAEVVGAAGLTFDPYNPDDIGRQICRIAIEPATLAELRRNALARARDYSWSKAAELTLMSLERCASGT
jgi:glycosyltransferase involved in cell wall biosynthesis